MNHQQKKFSVRVVAAMLFFIVFIPFLPLLLSWRWHWWEAWVYAGVSIGGFVVSRALAARRHPDLLAERARFLQHEDARPGTRPWRPWSGLAVGRYHWWWGWMGCLAGRLPLRRR